MALWGSRWAPKKRGGMLNAFWVNRRLIRWKGPAPKGQPEAIRNQAQVELQLSMTMATTGSMSPPRRGQGTDGLSSSDNDRAHHGQRASDSPPSLFITQLDKLELARCRPAHARRDFARPTGCNESDAVAAKARSWWCRVWCEGRGRVVAMVAVQPWWR